MVMWKNHSTCTTCAQLAEERQQRLSKQDIDLVDARKASHINSTMSDRQLNVRGNRLAARPENIKDSWPDTVKLMIDGMDQAKCLLPRPKKILGTSSWSQLWKPTQHIAGVIACGLVEIYFLLPPDCPKDSNMNDYLIGRTLEIIQQMEGIQVPGNLLLAGWHSGCIWRLTKIAGQVRCAYDLLACSVAPRMRMLSLQAIEQNKQEWWFLFSLGALSAFNRAIQFFSLAKSPGMVRVWFPLCSSKPSNLNIGTAEPLLKVQCVLHQFDDDLSPPIGFEDFCKWFARSLGVCWINDH